MWTFWSNYLHCCGHVERMPSEEVCKKLCEGSVEGKRPRGRPRKRWLDQVEEYLREKEVMSERVRRKCVKRYMKLDEAKVVCRDRAM